MPILLTWSDRTAGRLRGPGQDPGPIRRLLTRGGVAYDAVLLLTTRGERGGARALAQEIRRLGPEVEVYPLDVRDPSDHTLLFTALQGLLADLPEVEIDVLLSAGTPQAQTMWVILVQAGLLRARMLQVIPPRFVPTLHPEPVREVRLDVEGFPEVRALREEVQRLRARVATVTGDLVGDSGPMRRLAERIGRVAVAEVPVLALGETGSGKELVARAIHAAGPRAERPFVAENCGAFDEGLLASELFGHEAGAFTGAVGARRGLFEQADGGTLFLDEVAEMSPAVQVRLLRVLQEGRLRRLGSEETIPVDVRVIAATHRDLSAMVAEGSFREDLFYRLRGAILEVPALRERRGDLEPLVAHFLKQAGAALRPTRAAWQAMLAWPWPGNVRELQSEVRRWTVFCDDVVSLDDLAPEIAAGRRALGAPFVGVSDTPADQALPTLAAAVAAAERAAVDAAWTATRGNISAAARNLGVDRNTLKRKLKRYALR